MKTNLTRSLILAGIMLLLVGFTLSLDAQSVKDPGLKQSPCSDKDTGSDPWKVCEVDSLKRQLSDLRDAMSEKDKFSASLLEQMAGLIKENALLKQAGERQFKGALDGELLKKFKAVDGATVNWQAQRIEQPPAKVATETKKPKETPNAP